MSNLAELQLTKRGELRHFLTPEGLDRIMLERILDTADSFVVVGNQEVKKVPLLRGRTVVNLFFENSTRTRSTFELAAQRLSADVLTLDIKTSAAKREHLDADGGKDWKKYGVDGIAAGLILQSWFNETEHRLSNVPF